MTAKAPATSKAALARRTAAFLGSVLNVFVGLVFAVWFLAAACNATVLFIAGENWPVAHQVVDFFATHPMASVLLPVLAFDLWRRTQIDRVDLRELALLREIVQKHRDGEPTRVRAIVSLMRSRGEL